MPSMSNEEQQHYDPFEPGRSTPEFQRYARENYTSQKKASRPNPPRKPQHSAPKPARVQPRFKGGSFVRGLIITIVLAFAIEIFGFNLSYFMSMSYPEAGTYLVNGEDPADLGAIALDAEDSLFEITGLNATVKSIHFVPALKNPKAAGAVSDSRIQITMSLVDEGNANYYQLPSVTIDPEDESTTYISLEPAGKCHSILVNATNLAAIGPITVSDIELNAQVPFDFDPVRLLIIWAIILFLYELRPQSQLFSRELDFHVGWQRACAITLVIVQVAAIFLLVLSNTYFVDLAQTDTTENYFQYQKLAEALLEGHVYLDDIPSEALQAMDNPYDTNARVAQGVSFLWDHAYYHGKYYVYFGILPCLVFHLPWLLVTGTGFPTWLGVAICDAFFAIGVCYLLYQICRRRFKRSSFGVFVALDLMVFIAGGGLIVARTPSMYFLPEAMSLALIVWGLALWVRGTADHRIRMGSVMAGALLVALTMAARPQMVLAAVLGIVLVWPFLVGKPGYENKRGSAIGAILCAMIPFIAIGVCLLIYNKMRFGSPFDFGANYNLTTNDMIHRGFHIERIPFGLFVYLVQPPVLGSQFPFMHQTYYDPAYQGITIYEPMFGGYFWLYSMTLILVLLPRAKQGLQNRSVFSFVVVSLILAFVILNFDLQASGLLMRYMCDFGIFIALPAAFVFLQFTQIEVDAPLQRGYTQLLTQEQPNQPAQNSTDTVSLMRVSLYFMFITLIAMFAIAALLWNAFGMY